MKRAFTLLSVTLLALLATTESIFSQPSREWTIVATYTIPGKASGLTWDGTYLYSGLYGTVGDDNLIYQIDPTNGSYTLLCYAPQETSYGLSHDGTDFWSTDRTGAYTPAIAVEFDYSGNLLSSFELPATYISGIEYDAGNFWVCCYYNPDGMVYHLDGSGNILDQFPSPNNQPWAICKENNNLWIADYNANMLYKVATDGTLLESHPSENIKPSGITFDGQYLWYCDGQTNTPSTLYKVDLGGSGTPALTIPDDSHDYGIVVVGDEPTWNMLVQNTGTGDLVIEQVVIPAGEPVSTSFATPTTINPGNSTYIPLTYAPTEPGSLNTVVNILSNDPVNPTIPVTLTGEAVAPGPMLQAQATSHGYGNVRIRAYTRWYLQLWNIGGQDLILSDITFNGQAFFLDEAVELPLTLAPLDTTRIGVWFHPDSAVTFNDIMHITNNDPNQNPFDVYLAGTGLEQPWPMGTPLWHYTIDVSYDNSPKAIAPIQDITGDKVNDVIICSEDNFIRCFNGNSHGVADVMWEREVYAGSVYRQTCLVMIDDIDGDDCQEVVVGTAWGDRSIICLSGKTGEIIWKHDTHEYGSGGWVYQVDARFDYNSDGVLDILASTGDDSGDTGPKRIYCLDALTGESIWECYTGGPNFSVIGIEDVTGDGIPDALAGASNNEETQGKIYAINGGNGSIFWSVDASGSSVWALEQLDDLDEDGIQDVLAGDFGWSSGGHLYILSGASGNVITNSSIGSNNIMRFEKFDDVNEDGHLDILVAHAGSNGLVISGADASNIWLTSLADQSQCVAKANDLNGDGISEAYIGTLYSNNFVYYLDGSDGAEMESIHYSSAVDALNAIPDIVGDGTYEVVVGGRSGLVYCYSGGIEIPVGIEEGPNASGTPLEVEVSPNPFSGQLRLSFELKGAGPVEARVFSSKGTLVKTLYKGSMGKGQQVIYWNGRDEAGASCSAGTYIYTIKAGSASASGAVILTQPTK